MRVRRAGRRPWRLAVEASSFRGDENAESWVTATRERLATRKRCREQGRCHILGAPGMRVSNSGESKQFWPGILALWGESRKLLHLMHTRNDVRHATVRNAEFVNYTLILRGLSTAPMAPLHSFCQRAH